MCINAKKMGVTSPGCHTRPVCTQGFTRSLKLCQECGFNSCVRVFFIPWGHVNNHAQIWAFVTSISHMGEILDSDWSRQNLLRSDWLLLKGATSTTTTEYRVSQKMLTIRGTSYILGISS